MHLRRGELRPSSTPLQKLLRPPGRQTNQALLIVLLFALGTGVATVAIGSPDGAWVAIGHGICGMAVVLLIPWKSRVVRGGLQRARLSRWLSLLLATLDCTSGWYSHQDWTGVPLGTLLRRGPGAQSMYVHSVTGYWVRFPIQDLDLLLLATQVGGAPLSTDHGFPVRLVAPGGGATGG